MANLGGGGGGRVVGRGVSPLLVTPSPTLTKRVIRQTTRRTTAPWLKLPLSRTRLSAAAAAAAGARTEAKRKATEGNRKITTEPQSLAAWAAVEGSLICAAAVANVVSVCKRLTYAVVLALPGSSWAWQAGGTAVLLLAVFVGAVLRWRTWAIVRNIMSNSYATALVDGPADAMGLTARVAKLEQLQDLDSRYMQVSGRQQTKLQLRMRVMRRVMRDDIRTIAREAQETTATVQLLASKAEAHARELAETQQLLLAMQAVSEKQFRVLSKAVPAATKLHSQVLLPHRTPTSPRRPQESPTSAQLNLVPHADPHMSMSLVHEGAHLMPESAEHVSATQMQTVPGVPPQTLSS
eukprot:jgi/Chlat1/2030/Chrsp159S02333